MIDIELVIKVPEKLVCEGFERHFTEEEKNILIKAIGNGTPLPKGHGRLIDANALEKRMLDRELELNDDRALWESSAVSVALDMFAPTIIESDKESEDKVK